MVITIDRLMLIPYSLINYCKSLTTETKEYIDSKITKIALITFTAISCFYLTKQYPILICTGALFGIVFPESSVKATNFLFESIINPRKDLSFKNPPQFQHTSTKILWTADIIFNKIQPGIAIGMIGLLALPVATVQIITLLVGNRLAACKFSFDLFWNKEIKTAT